MNKLNYKKAIKLINKLVPYIKGLRGDISNKEYELIAGALLTIDRGFMIKIAKEQKTNEV